MDHLYLNSIVFPVRRSTLSQGRNESTEYRWDIEIHCGESPQLDYTRRPDDKPEEPTDWLTGTEPYLYAQMLPLRAASPDELVGRRYEFPQSPDDEPPDWPAGIGWPFFVLYTLEHDWAYPMSVAFTAKRDRQYRVEIAGKYPADGVQFDLKVHAWLDWME